MILMCASALAQGTTSNDCPKVEVFVGYSALGGAGGGGISFGSNRGVGGNYSGDGFEASLVRNFRKRFGIKGDYSAHFNNDSARGPITDCTTACTTVTEDFQLKTRVYNFLAGPEFKASNSTRFTPFVHALGGFAHTSATFTTPGPTLVLLLRRNDNSFAMSLASRTGVEPVSPA